MAEGWRSVAGLAGGIALGLALFVSPGSAASAEDAAPDADLRPIVFGEFCQTGPAFNAGQCNWQRITLPHRWSPEPGDEGWGVYRFRIPYPGPGYWGVVTEGLSMRGAVRVAGRTLEPVTAFSSRGEHLRYWPQFFPFHLAAPANEALLIELDVHGHVLEKSGLTGLNVAPEPAARQLYLRTLARNVGLPLAIAAAIGMVGVITGLSSRRIGDRARPLSLLSLLAVLAALRIVLNAVPDPPVSVRTWSVLNLALYFHIGLAMIAIPATHLQLIGRRTAAGMLLSAVAAVLGMALLPAAAVIPAWEAALTVVGAIGVWLCGRLTVAVFRHRRTEDVKMAAMFLPILALPIHDLAVHLGPQSMSSDYWTLWALPAGIPLTAVMLFRNLLSHQALQGELQREGERREELLRDLHDGVGSRLVALSFHARRGELGPSVLNELEALIQEVRLIQRSVRAGPLMLDDLLVDLRYQYSGIGGGGLPLIWAPAGNLPAYRLTAEQSVATTRILAESISNALKHARPGEIRIALDRGDEPGSLQLTISDDGQGAFKLDAGSGLRNIELRAERAGLRVAFEQRDGRKAVKLLFPPRARRAAWRRLFGRTPLST